MSELSINESVRWILGILGMVAIMVGLGFIFKDKLITFFQNLPGSAPTIFLNLIK